MADHYYTEQPDTPFNTYPVEIQTSFTRFSIQSSSSIFSKDELDTGSQLLIEKVKDDVTGDVLDLGCGYGVIGISLLIYNPELNLTFVDINTRAIKLTKMNLDKLNLDGEVIQSDGFEEISTSFDCIVSNPPISAGMDICKRFIKDAFEHLRSGGNLFLVGQHNNGGSRLKAMMNERFGNSERIGKNKGFKVYKSEK